MATWTLVVMCLAVRAVFLSYREWRGKARDGTDLLVALILGTLWLAHRQDPLVAYGLDLQHPLLWATALPVAIGLGLVANLCHLLWKHAAAFRASKLALRMHDYGSQWLPDAPAEVQGLAAPFFIAAHTLLEELLFRGVMLLDLAHRWPAHAQVWNLIQALVFAALHVVPILALGGAPAGYLLTAGAFSGSAGWLLGTFVLQSGSLWPAWIMHCAINAIAFYYGPRTQPGFFEGSGAGESEVTVVSLQGVHKRYGSDVIALDGLSLDLKKGEILGLLGPNGAGKTTAVKLICGLLQPDEGTVRFWSGYDPKQVGVLLEGDRSLIERLTGRENMEYFAGLRGLKAGRPRADAIQRLLDVLGLGRVADKCVSEYSRGMRQRLSIAIALVTDPGVVLLDEPTLGLDVEATELLKETLRNLAGRGLSVLVTTHQMDVAQTLCHRVAIMTKGQVALTDTPANLVALFATRGYEIRVVGSPSEDVVAALASLGHVEVKAEEGHGVLVLNCSSPEGIYEAFPVLAAAHIELVGVRRCEPNLAQVYLAVVKREAERNAVVDCAPGRM